MFLRFDGTGFTGRETAPYSCVHLLALAMAAGRGDSVAPLLRWTLSALLMSLIMGWVARSRMRPRPVRSERQLRHPISTLIIGLAGFLLFAAIAVVSNVFANATTSWWTTGIFVGFALMALPITGDYFAARHEVSEEGLRYGRLIGSGGLLRWDEVKSVRYSPGMKWFRLELQSGVVVRLSVMLMGLPVFATLLLARARSDAIDPETRLILQATAEGNPPSVWSQTDCETTYSTRSSRSIE